MLLKLISCNVFQREACLCLADSPHVIDPEFTELGEHSRSAGLRTLLQERIDAAEAGTKTYDAILLLFGLCGNATIGLHTRQTRLVIPRAHDCCTILLGSRRTFQEHFQDNPSTPFGSAGYMERGDYFLRTSDDGDPKVTIGDAYQQLVEKFGAEDAQFIWDQMHPPGQAGQDKAVFIDVPETAHLGYRDKFHEKAAAAGKQVVDLPGNLHLIRNLLHGHWDPAEFLVLSPGQQAAGVYDWDQIIKAKPT